MVFYPEFFVCMFLCMQLCKPSFLKSLPDHFQLMFTSLKPCLIHAASPQIICIPHFTQLRNNEVDIIPTIYVAACGTVSLLSVSVLCLQQPAMSRSASRLVTTCSRVSVCVRSQHPSKLPSFTQTANLSKYRWLFLTF